MGEERLTGLATMRIHRDIHVKVDRFASKKRKISFLLDSCKTYLSFLFSTGLKNFPLLKYFLIKNDNSLIPV